MNIIEATEYIDKGYNIFRLKWDRGFSIYVDKGIICLTDTKGYNYPYTITLQDIKAKDWQVKRL